MRAISYRNSVMAALFGAGDMALRLLILTAVLLSCVLSLPATAGASPAQLAIFQADGELLYASEAERERALDELRDLGADVVKVHAVWRRLAPEGAEKPGGFRGWEPGDYDQARFAALDAVVRGARERGMRVLLSPTGPAPGWATARPHDDSGAWRPDAREFGRFVRALARRYDGTHLDADGRLLPRVRFWSIWNEPNHPLFLRPLGSRSRRYHIAPHLYRELLRWALDGLRREGHRRDSVLFGELLPIGHSRYGPRNTIKPIAFLREFFCLDRDWRPYRGRAARVRGCHRYRPPTGVTGFAIHPYSRPVGPRTIEPSEDDATIRSLDRVARALDRAAALGRVRRGLGIYNTEYGFQSDPPDRRLGAPLSRIPAFLNEAEWMTYRDRRVKSWSQYALRDDTDLDGFQSGLYFASGERKDRVYAAYRMPLFVRLLGEREVEVWGGVRLPEARGREVRVQVRVGNRWRNLHPALRIESYRGYVRRTFRVSDARKRLFRLRYVRADGTELTSRSARPARREDAE